MVMGNVGAEAPTRPRLLGLPAWAWIAVAAVLALLAWLAMKP